MPFPEGSNNWAISGARTTTGRPILANDPHRALTAPSLRYLAHLNAPGLDVIGAGEPFAPGISLGHNGTSSFGLTVFAIDQEDLYVYELDPADHKRYRYGDGWEEMKTITEPIIVAGGAQATAELTYTRHGPVIKVDSANHRAYALRAVWLEPGMSPYYGSMRYLRAKTFTEFRDAIDVGDWDASRAVNAPGQSGDPDDPHYRDLTAKWHNGQYFPLVYSKPAVLANVEKTIVLLPRQ